MQWLQNKTIMSALPLAGAFLVHHLNYMKIEGEAMEVHIIVQQISVEELRSIIPSLVKMEKENPGMVVRVEAKIN